MEQKKDICPHCGSTETVIGKQWSHGQVFSKSAITMFVGQNLFHVICLDCGTVIRSYIDHPKQLI